MESSQLIVKSSRRTLWTGYDMSTIVEARDAGQTGIALDFPFLLDEF